VVAWYDNRRGLTNSAGHFKLDVYATYSTDGGLTFAPAFPVNDQTPGVNTPNGNIFDPDPGTLNYLNGPPPSTTMGEYFGIGIWGGTAYVAWNGNLFGGFNNPIDQQVWTKAFAIRGSLTVTGTPGNDYITIRSMADHPAFVEVIVNGQRQYAGLWSALTSITLNATSGDDSVQIDDTVPGTPVTVNLGNGNDSVDVGLTSMDLGAIQGPLTIHGGTGSNFLFIPDEHNAASTTYSITGSSVARTGSAGISYDHISRLYISRGSGTATFEVLGGHQGTLVWIVAGLGYNTLNIDDSSNTADTTYTVADSSVLGPGRGPVFWSNSTNLVLTGGSGNNTYNVLSTQSHSSTTLNTGNGVDVVNMRGAAGPLFINSGSGGDTITLSNNAGTLAGLGHVIVNDPSNRATVTVDDSGFASSTTYTVTSTQVAATAWPNFLLVYNNLASLNLNGSSGDDQFNIESTAGGTATTVSAGSGSNRFDLTRSADYLAAVAGPLNLLGSGADTLAFWDQANPNSETYTFDDVPSTLALLTVPAFETNWSGMATVYLETNHMSTVNDPSGTVLVDMPPPGAGTGLPQLTPAIAVERSLVQALLDDRRDTSRAPVLVSGWSIAGDWVTP
jgi:hypothetical protein